MIRVQSVNRDTKTITFTNGNARITYCKGIETLKIGYFTNVEYRQLTKQRHGIEKSI